MGADWIGTSTYLGIYIEQKKLPTLVHSILKQWEPKTTLQMLKVLGLPEDIPEEKLDKKLLLSMLLGSSEAKKTLESFSQEHSKGGEDEEDASKVVRPFVKRVKECEDDDSTYPEIAVWLKNDVEEEEVRDIIGNSKWRITSALLTLMEETFPGYQLKSEVSGYRKDYGPSSFKVEDFALVQSDCDYSGGVAHTSVLGPYESTHYDSAIHVFYRCPFSEDQEEDLKMLAASYNIELAYCLFMISH